MPAAQLHIVWNDGTRIAAVRCTPDALLTGPDAQHLKDTMKASVGVTAQPYALLVDTSGIRGTTAEYRSISAAFYREQGAALIIALFNLNPIVRILAEIFRVGIGLDIKTFKDEVHARAWLRQRGFAA